MAVSSGQQVSMGPRSQVAGPSTVHPSEPLGASPPQDGACLPSLLGEAGAAAFRARACFQTAQGHATPFLYPCHWPHESPFFSGPHCHLGFRSKGPSGSLKEEGLRWVSVLKALTPLGLYVCLKVTSVGLPFPGGKEVLRLPRQSGNRLVK